MSNGQCVRKTIIITFYNINNSIYIVFKIINEEYNLYAIINIKISLNLNSQIFPNIFYNFPSKRRIKNQNTKIVIPNYRLNKIT